MIKYRVTIEFSTDKPLKFPHDAMLLEAMTAQAESLEDGEISSAYKVEMQPANIEEFASPILTLNKDIGEPIKNRQEMVNELAMLEARSEADEDHDYLLRLLSAIYSNGVRGYSDYSDEELANKYQEAIGQYKQDFNFCPKCHSPLHRGNNSEDGGSGMPEPAFCPSCDYIAE